MKYVKKILLVALLLNSYIILYAQNTQMNNGFIDTNIAFYFLLFLLIAFGISFYIFKRYRNNVSRDSIATGNEATNKIEEINTIIQMLPVSVAILSAEGLVIEINERGAMILGVADKDVLKGFSLESSPIIPESIKEAFRKREDIHTNFSYDMSKVRKLNYYKTSKTCDTLQIDLKGKPIFDSNGNLKKYILVIEDVSEITNLNETLSDLHNESQVLLQSLPVGIAIYDKDTEVKYLNKAVAEIFGIDDIEAHIKKGASLFDDPAVSIEDKQKLKKGDDFEKIFEYDLKVVSDSDFFDTKYQHKMYIDGKTRLIKDSEGTVIKYILILNDITEKHRAKLILEDSERNLKLAIKAGGIDSWSYDVKSEIFYPLGDIDSFKKEAFTLDDYNRIIHPDDISTRDGLINDIIQGKIDRTHTILRYKTDAIQGKYSYFEIHMMAKKENGVVVTIPFAQKDITERYLHEVEREYSQKKTAFAISSAELALWEYCAVSHTFTTHNATAIGLDSVGNLSVDDFCKSLNADESSNVEFRAIVSEMSECIDKSYAIDIKISPKSTDVYEYMSCTLECSPFEKDKNGRVIKYVGFIKDYTKWATLNETLVDLNTQLKTVFDVGQIFPFICDVKDGKFFFRATVDEEPNLFIDVNTELTWEQVKMVIHLEDREKIENLFMSLINGDVSKVCDEIRYCSEPIRNQIYEVNMSTAHDQNFNDQITIIGYLQDITERKQMIFELEKAKQEAEQSAKVKAAFLANMSHEIRTPLNAIIGFSELLAREEEEETKAEFINIISTNNDLLLKLINDILDLSKMDAGFVEIDVSEFDFSQFFNEMHISMQQRMTKPNIKLSIINPYSKCIVKLDKNRLAQVCINYITNAIKYTAKGSIDMGYECINGGLKIYVKDTGIGVDDDNKHKLFQRFEKFDDFAQGTGLGLSITKALIEHMQGEVGFESKLGSGSTFWAWIPCSAASVAYAAGGASRTRI